MTPEEFRTIRVSLGFTQASLGEKLEVNPRTIRRWESPSSGFTAPPGVVDTLQAQWGLYADRVADAMDAAEEMEAQGEPATLFAYGDELECMTSTGLSLEEHTALLGHIAMALTCADIDFEIIEVPPNEGNEK